jgi:hypothetical protein
MAIDLGGNEQTQHSSGGCFRRRSEPSQHRNNWNSLMSKEFEKLEALLYVSEPSERDPPVDRGEAAKLAARWGWLVRRSGEQRVELPQTQRPSTSSFFG